MKTLGLVFAPPGKFLLAAAVFCFCSAVVQAQLQRNDSERQLFESVNRERTDQGFPPLQWDESLFKAARKHALLMLNLNQLEHQLPGEPGLEARLAEAGARFAVIAENIAIGKNPEIIHNGWMRSPGHRKNILDPRMTSVGIAVVNGPGGLYAVQDFSQFVPELSREQQEQKVISLLTSKGFRLADATDDARRTCEKDSGLSGSSAKAMMRFEASDLNSLPKEVEERIHSAPIGKFAVGACPPKGESGFSRFRIALLFF